MRLMKPAFQFNFLAVHNKYNIIDLQELVPSIGIVDNGFSINTLQIDKETSAVDCNAIPSAEHCKSENI